MRVDQAGDNCHVKDAVLLDVDGDDEEVSLDNDVHVHHISDVNVDQVDGAAVAIDIDVYVLVHHVGDVDVDVDQAGNVINFIMVTAMTPTSMGMMM